MFPTLRDAMSYIMYTFPIVRRKDEKAKSEYRTKRVILENYDQMTEVMKANGEWQIAEILGKRFASTFAAIIRH